MSDDSQAQLHADGTATRSCALEVVDSVTVHYALDTGVFLEEAARKKAVAGLGRASLASKLIPTLAMGARIWLADDGARIEFRIWEPLVERTALGVRLRRFRRQVVVRGELGLFWTLIEVMDGNRSVEAILQHTQRRDEASDLLESLAATGAVDISGRPYAQFLHSATKNETLPTGGLDIAELTDLVMEDRHRHHSLESDVPLNAVAPERLRPLEALLRSRRSPDRFAEGPVSLVHFLALIQTAAGLTGCLDWSGRNLNLRAYPSAGGLYSVEIYPVVFNIEGVEPAVYQYIADDRVLELRRAGISRRQFIDAAVPIQKAGLERCAALFCLTGRFQRFEQKYGEGGYRILAAEAGHISQNLILAATALGLGARPCGGFFEALLNAELDLTDDSEQFLLAVVVGNVEPPGRDE